MTFTEFRDELKRMGGIIRQSPNWSHCDFYDSGVTVYFDPFREIWSIYFSGKEITEITTFEEALAWITVMERMADPTPF